MNARASRRIRIALGVAGLLVLLSALAAAPASADFGLAGIGGEIRADAGGTAATQAGSHPAEASVSFELTRVEREVRNGGGPLFRAPFPSGSLRTSITQLPPGLVGNPTATPRCTNVDFENGIGGLCPDDTQVGIAEVVFTNFSGEAEVQFFKIYNLVPQRGEPARLAGRLEGAGAPAAAVVLDASLRTGEGPGSQYGITLTDVNIPTAIPIIDVKVTLWGVPADSSHDTLRGGCVTAYGPTGESCPVRTQHRPFITTPTECGGGTLGVTQSLDAWEQPGAFLTERFEFATAGAPNRMTGCEKLVFDPTLSAKPTTSAADSPTGLDVDVHVPQTDDPTGLATSHLRDAVITLPEGMTVNPSAANGLGACAATGIELAGPGQANPAACPGNAKVGSVEIETPLLDHPLPGAIYLAKQGENKFGSLLAIYLAIDDPRSGVVVKVPGRIEAGPSGRLTARFANAPQLPFVDIRASFYGGDDAVLMTPPSCGTYTVGASFTPWSGSAPVSASDSFVISSGPGGGPCAAGAFDPTFTAGSANPVAGAFSPFLLAVSRADGTQRLASIGASLPPGLLAKLGGVPYCPEAALAGISPAEGSGAAQLAAPSCPAASAVGTVAVAAGAGSRPFGLETGRVYLAGPYHGAPLSLAFVVPALAGPFDLGNVVVRTALRVDPTTTQVTAVSDPLPTILHGIPIDLRQVRVSLDRPEFTVNPTSCAPTRVTSAIASVGGQTRRPASSFGITDCARLGFKPKLALTLRGATGRSGNPALRAELKAKAGGANVGRVRVTLPPSEFIDQAHISNPCTRVQFAADACPAKSVLGRARAFSPLLDQPLEGPVYFRSNGGERELPDLVADLHGQIDVVLVGFIDSQRAKKGSKGSGASRVRTTFASVPDAPVSKFVLNLKGGKRGLLENSVDLCKGTQRAEVSAVGQNGRHHDFRQRIGTKGCR